MSTKDNAYKSISESFKAIRNIEKNGVDAILNESEDNSNETDNKNAVPYSQQDELFKNSLQPCKIQFGADFSRLKNPMLYYPEDGDITLSGVIPSLNNAKFQFRYLEPSGNGCFVWVNGIQLTKDIITRLNRIYGVYQNWRQQLSTSEDNKPLHLKNEQ